MSACPNHGIDNCDTCRMSSDAALVQALRDGPSDVPEDPPVPPRVLAAEERRRFRELLSRSSLGCPVGWPGCGHMASSHDCDEYDDEGRMINPVCMVAGCNCGHDEGDS